MLFILIGAGLLVLVGAWIIVGRIRIEKTHDDVESHSVTAEALHDLLQRKNPPAVLDVRQPLDLLAYPEIIPGSRRIPPDDVLQQPSLIPADQDAIVYCTCPDDKTSRRVIRRAQALHLSKVKFLKGGLAGWKAEGYPVEPFRGDFQLHPRTEPSRQ